MMVEHIKDLSFLDLQLPWLHNNSSSSNSSSNNNSNIHQKDSPLHTTWPTAHLQCCHQSSTSFTDTRQNSNACTK